ncbi:MAG TPA: hypothetical protein PKA58_27765, partial [Polyangium sp.]|nr:hypothetical protein [Polyangium sp.]
MTNRRPLQAVVGTILGSALFVAACSLEPSSTPGASKGTAQPLGIYTTELPIELEKQAVALVPGDYEA